MMLHKTWNIRDQTEKELRFEADKLYLEIETGYKMLKKLSNIEDAKKTIDRIWIMKSWAKNIELELIQREHNNET